MKTLLILRHGKAETHSPSGDKGRALTERGERDAAAVGVRILEAFGCPDLIVASDATRARQTAQVVAGVAGYPAEIEWHPEIYESEVGDLLDVVLALPDHADCVLLVGHNPGLERLAGVLDAEPTAFVSLPTAGLAPLRFEEARWEDVRPRSGRRVSMTTQHTKEKGT